MRKQSNKTRSTTVLLVRKDNSVAMAGDGQVTMGETIMKGNARKVRRLYNDTILAGFAGATADAFSLLTRFESKLEQYNGNLERASIELSKEWRTDKLLRHLEALLVVADNRSSFCGQAMVT
jgi:ATP-dependent HslUV protease subunit HslV